MSISMHHFIVGDIFLDKYVGSLDDCLLLGLHFVFSSFLVLVLGDEV